MRAETYISVHGVRLHVVRRQGPGETLVFIHGMTDNATSWQRVIGALGPYYDVISYDLRAHGSSDTPASGYEIDDHATDLAGIVDHLGLACVTLIGHSLGAEIGAKAACRLADRIVALVMIDPPWHKDWLGAPDQHRHLMARNWRRWIAQLGTMPIEEVVGIAKVETPHWDDEDMWSWARGKHEARAEAIESLLAFRPGWQSIVAQLSCPTLLVVGDSRMGGAVSTEQAEEARRVSPLLEVVHLPGAGHGIHRDKFDGFMQALRSFLRR
jgi:pimeloyl-ACP methyl ester carboxylesterase